MSKINFEEDSNQLTVTSEQLKNISTLASLQINLMADIESLEKKLDDLKKRHLKVSEVDLPDAMSAAGVESFVTSKHESIKIKEKLYASFPKAEAKRRAALDWLIKNKQSAIIKENVTVLFDKGDEKKLQKFLKKISTMDVNYKLNEDVNTATIKALINEMMEQGKDVPLDVLGAYKRKFAEVKYDR